MEDDTQRAGLITGLSVNSHRYNQSTLAAKSRIKEREQSRKKSKTTPLEEPF